MNYVCPTVTATDVHSYRSQLELVAGFAPRIHIDLMDGDLAPTVSPNPDLLWVPEGVEVDIHVMYRDPTPIIDRLISFKPSLIIVHAESNADIPKLASQLRQHNIKTGVALLPETSAEDVRYILPHVQHALIFGGHLGYHGGKADLSQLAKINDLKQMHHYLEYGWDGGATLGNMAQLLEAGVNVINVGDAIHKAEHPDQAYATMIAKLTS